jgi:hypothetical protein
MARKATRRSVDALMAQLIDELGSQLKGSVDADGNRVPPTAAVLAVAAKVLANLNVTVDLTQEESRQRIKDLFAQGLPYPQGDKTDVLQS